MNIKKSLSLFLLLNLATNSFAPSIEQLLQQGKIPAVQGGKLNLSGLGITDLKGLGQILGIADVEVLALNDNDLAVIPARGFSPCKNVTAIGLERNKISKVEPFAFAECTKLKAIVLNKNNLSMFEKDAFAGPVQLEVLSLNRNPGLTKNKKEIQRLKEELPQTKVTTGPFTKQQWIKIGVATAVIAAAIAAVAVVVTRSTSTPGQKPALVEAAEKGELARVKELLGQGVDVNAHAEGGWTALEAAAAKGRTEIVRILLAKNGIKFLDHALGAAVSNNRTDIVTILLEAGAQATKDEHGVTVLMEAVTKGNIEIVKALLGKRLMIFHPSRGLISLINYSDMNGRTALGIAKALNNKEIIELLEEKLQESREKNYDPDRDAQAKKEWSQTKLALVRCY